MIGLPYRRTSRLVVALLFLVGARVFGQTQTPGQVTQFDPNLNVVDSVITQDPSGNIGIGTTTPAAALDVASGDLDVAGNILKGGVLFLHNFGSGNTFLGQNAGNLTMTGSNNTGSGAGALASNTAGNSNTASGVFALFSNTTGYQNTASGVGALGINTTGFDNTASGYQALVSNTTGQGNTASGVQALVSNSTGDANTANGAYALYRNTGAGNTASGSNALFFNTTGPGNTASGSNALYDNTTGYNNTAIGTDADVSQGNLFNATAIGAGAVVNDSNKVRLGNDAVTVIEGRVPYTFTSDKHQKENFQVVDGEEVLRKLGNVNITSWNYIGHDPQQFRHYGPVAQEFFAAFGQRTAPSFRFPNHPILQGDDGKGCRPQP